MSFAATCFAVEGEEDELCSEAGSLCEICQEYEEDEDFRAMVVMFGGCVSEAWCSCEVCQENENFRAMETMFGDCIYKEWCLCAECQEREEYETFCAMVEMFGCAIVTEEPSLSVIADVVLLRVALEGYGVLDAYNLRPEDLSLEALSAVAHMRRNCVGSVTGRRGAVSGGGRRSKYQQSYR